MIKLILIFISLLLFVFNYPVCCYFFPDSPETIDGHYDLRFNIYATILFLMAIVLQLKTEKRLKQITDAVLLVCTLTCASDVYDRAKGVTKFNYFDILLILIFIGISIYRYKHVRKNKITS